VKKSNVKVSQNKAKRYAKNKKRTKNKPYISKFEKQQIAIREQIIMGALRPVANTAQ
jgi:hypothetical protein